MGSRNIANFLRKRLSKSKNNKWWLFWQILKFNKNLGWLSYYKKLSNVWDLCNKGVINMQEKTLISMVYFLMSSCY